MPMVEGGHMEFMRLNIDEMTQGSCRMPGLISKNVLYSPNNVREAKISIHVLSHMLANRTRPRVPREAALS